MGQTIRLCRTYDEWGNHYPAIIRIRKISSSSRSFQPPQDAQTTTEVFFTIITSSVLVVLTYIGIRHGFLACFSAKCLQHSIHHFFLLQTEKAVLLFSLNGLIIFKAVRFALRVCGMALFPSHLPFNIDFFPPIEGLAWQPAQELWVTSS